jgi:long-subunit fatty acid transport protein
MVISVNYQRLYEFKRSLNYQYDLSSAGLSLVQDKHFRQDGYIGAYGFAYALQITPKFSAGATFNLWTDQLLSKNGWSETYTEHSSGTQGGAPVTIDTTITDTYSRFRGINANLGVLWNINDQLTAGAVVKTPFTASLHHEFGFATTSAIGPPANITISNQQSITEEVKLRMPLSYGLGLSMRTSDALSFAFDIYRTEWSEYILKDAQGNEFSPVDGRPKNDSNVKATTQIRLGAEYLIIGHETVVPLRGGLFYDPEPSHGALKDFFGVSVGSGISYQGIVFDAAYQLRRGHNVDTGNLINSSRADINQQLMLASIIYHF